MILERIPGERLSRILPAWKGRVLVYLAGGPSLTREQFAAVAAARAADRVRVIAINDSYLLAPWADVHYAADAKWHRWHTAGIPKPELELTADDVRARWAAFAGQKGTIQTSANDVADDVHVLRNKVETYPNHANALSDDPCGLYSGRHGGFQALNMGILAGGAVHLLCGYDARLGPEGEKHWHGDHPVPSRLEDAYKAFRQSFIDTQDAIAATGAEVINCSPRSSIDTFRRMPLDLALEAAA